MLGIKRRQFITHVAGAAAAWPLEVRATGGQIAHPWIPVAFVQRLRELGWIEGRTVVWDLETVPDLAGLCSCGCVDACIVSAVA